MLTFSLLFFPSTVAVSATLVCELVSFGNNPGIATDRRFSLEVNTFRRPVAMMSSLN